MAFAETWPDAYMFWENYYELLGEQNPGHARGV